MTATTVKTVVWSDLLEPRAFWLPEGEARAILSAVAADSSDGMHLHVGERCVVYSETELVRIVYHLGRDCPPGAVLEVPEADVELEEPDTEIESLPVPVED